MEFQKIVAGISKLQCSDPELQKTLKDYVYPIIGCCQEVHNEMGPFLNE